MNTLILIDAIIKLVGAALLIFFAGYMVGNYRGKNGKA
jgi:hypothetical protein